ncbi:MAG: TlpA family protein disulfide reductase [Bacteroidales bacterium]|nr:TlpA family protein disulfide reductase [Bacteroidales bacterium]
MKKILLFILFFTNIYLFAQEQYPYVDERGFFVKIGQQAPDFKIVYTDGTSPGKLSDLRGKPIMLQFTASWCGVCRKEMPHIEKDIWQAYKDKGLILIGIDRKEKPEAVKKFAGIMKITYPLALDLNDAIYTLYAHPNSGVTRNVLIDPNGKIVFLTRLFDKKEFKELVNKINELCRVE